MNTGEQLLRSYRKTSAAASWIFGIIFVAFFIAVFFFVPNPTATQCGILRFVMSLTAGLFAFFFIGGVVLKGKLAGLAIGATGGFVLFILMQFVYDPIPDCQSRSRAGLKEWRGGQRLGSLIDTLAAAYASGETAERVIVDAGFEDQVRNFDPSVRAAIGQSWHDVIRRICSVNSCLVCEAGSDGALHLKTNERVAKRCADRDCKQYSYRCKTGG